MCGGPRRGGHRLRALHDQLPVLPHHGVWRHGGDVSRGLKHPLDGDKDREELCGPVHGWPSGLGLRPVQPIPPPGAGLFCLPPRYCGTRHFYHRESLSCHHGPHHHERRSKGRGFQDSRWGEVRGEGPLGDKADKRSRKS